MRLFLLALLLYNVSCNAQDTTNYFNEKQYVYQKDTINEADQVCKLLYNKADTNYRMIECYSTIQPKQLIARMFIKDGKYTGPCKYWTDDGQVSFVGEYFENQRHGKWTYYFGSGISAENYYDKGRKIGVWKDYDRNGKVIRKTDYGN